MNEHRAAAPDAATLPPVSTHDVVIAAQNADWGQVVANGGPPCFHLESDLKCFCLRAFRWPGHDVMHPYKPLYSLLEETALAAVAAERANLEHAVFAAVHHAVEACAAATGQHRVIAHFVNKTHVANEVIAAAMSKP